MVDLFLSKSEKEYLQKVILINGKKWINSSVTVYALGLKKLNFHDINIGGYFYADNNHLENLEGSPESVNGIFYVNNNRLKTLEGAPYRVGSIQCHNNPLKNAKGSPRIVNHTFNMAFCKELESLEGSPDFIGGDVILEYCNNLKTLKGLNEFGGSIVMDKPLPEDDYFIEYSLTGKIKMKRKTL